MAGYLDITAMQAYWAEQGYVVPSDADTADITSAWNRGASVIDRYEPRFSGRRTAGYQQLHAFPRTGATTYYGEPITDGETPLAIANASFEAGWLEFNNPGILSPVITGSATVKREKIGQLEVEYSSSSTMSFEDMIKLATPFVLTIEGLLWMFFRAPEPAILVV